MNRNSQRGAANLKAIFWIAVLLLVVYALFKISPHFINNYELKDLMGTEARFASVGTRNVEEVRETLYRKIQELEIPAEKSDIKIEKVDRRVRIRINYVVEVNFPGYTLKIPFENDIDNRGV